MITANELIERFTIDGLTVRRLRELEAVGVLNKVTGGPGRGNVFTYQDVPLGAFRNLLKDLKRGLTLDEARQRWKLAISPSILVAATDPFVYAAVLTRMKGLHSVHWAPQANIARQLIAQSLDLRIGALLCQSALPNWPHERPSADVANQLMSVAIEKGWLVRTFGSEATQDLPAQMASLTVPFPAETFAVPVLEHFKEAAQ